MGVTGSCNEASKSIARPVPCQPHRVLERKMRLFLAAASFFAGRLISSRRRDPQLHATMLRSHPVDATQIQRVAAPTPNNGIPLKRFYAAIATAKKINWKSQ